VAVKLLLSGADIRDKLLRLVVRGSSFVAVDTRPGRLRKEFRLGLGNLVTSVPRKKFGAKV